MEEDVLLKKLRWRCRRGMRELDQLFGRYLDHEWSTAPTEEREVFLFLLDCEDDKLWRWFMGYEACPHAHAIPHAEDPRPQALSGALAAAGRRPAGGAAGCAVAAARIGSAFTAADARGGAGLGHRPGRTGLAPAQPRVQVLLPPRPSRCRWPGRTSMHHGWWCVAHGCCCSGVRIGAAGCCSGRMCSIPGSDVNCDWPWPHAPFPVGPGRWHHKLN
jgi:antitoxin CptB